MSRRQVGRTDTELNLPSRLLVIGFILLLVSLCLLAGWIALTQTIAYEQFVKGFEAGLSYGNNPITSLWWGIVEVIDDFYAPWGGT